MQNLLQKVLFGLGAISFFLLLGVLWGVFVGFGNLLGHTVEGIGRLEHSINGAFVGMGIGIAYVFGTIRFAKRGPEFLQNQAMVFWGLILLLLAGSWIWINYFGGH